MLGRYLGNDLACKLGWLSGFAGSLAFFYLLSIIPFLIVILTAAHHLFSADLTPELVRLTKNLLPSESKVSAQTLVDIAKTMSSGGVITFNTIIAIWTTYSFMRELSRALQFIFCEMDFDHLQSNPWKSLLLLVAWMFTILITFGVFLISPLIIQLLKEKVWFETIASFMWKLLQYGVLLSILFTALWTTYRISAKHRLDRKRLIQGTWIATFGWVFMSLGFTWIIKLIWSQNILHGAWGSIIATLFWAYACAWSLLIGACWIRYWETKK